MSDILFFRGRQVRVPGDFSDEEHQHLVELVKNHADEVSVWPHSREKVLEKCQPFFDTGATAIQQYLDWNDRLILAEIRQGGDWVPLRTLS